MAAYCSNCGNLSGGPHARPDCPAIAAQNRNAAANHNLPAYGRPAVDAGAITPVANSIVQPVLQTLAQAAGALGPAVIAGLDVRTLEQLQEDANNKVISHTIFQAEIGRRVAVAPVANAADGYAVARLQGLIAWSTAVSTLSQPTVLKPFATDIHFKKGYLAKLLSSCYKFWLAREREDGLAAGTPVTLLRDLNGNVLQSTTEGGDEGLGLGRHTLVMGVWEIFRHILVGTGHSTELALHSFLLWHLMLIFAGTDLALVERLFAILVGLLDQKSCSWTTVISLHGAEQLAFLKERQANSITTGQGAEGSSSGGARDGKNMVREHTKEGMRYSSLCKYYNAYGQTGKSMECPSGAGCTQSHLCNARLGNGLVCGADHPSWLHAAKVSPPKGARRPEQ